MLSHAIVLASSMFDVSSRAKLSVSALAERKIASARPRKYGLLLRAEEEMLLYGQALARATLPAPCLRSAVRSSPSSCADARPRHPKDMGLERRMRKPRYSSSIPFYIERLPTYN